MYALVHFPESTLLNMCHHITDYSNPLLAAFVTKLLILIKLAF
jgi:hypothetical protein